MQIYDILTRHPLFRPSSLITAFISSHPRRWPPPSSASPLNPFQFTSSTFRPSFLVCPLKSIHQLSSSFSSSLGEAHPPLISTPVLISFLPCSSGGLCVNRARVLLMQHDGAHIVTWASHDPDHAAVRAAPLFLCACKWLSEPGEGDRQWPSSLSRLTLNG